MARGIMLVESKAASPDELDAFNAWYDEVHIPEILAVDGFVSARRFLAADGVTYFAVYEVDDIDNAEANLAAARAAGRMTAPVGLQLDPPPTRHYLPEIGAFTAC